jgi:hypothetical protein
LRGDEGHPLHKLALQYTLFELFHSKIDAAYELGMINRQTNLLSSYTGSSRANLRVSSAKNNLRNYFTFFGIHDVIEEFVEVCGFYLGWPEVGVPKANSSGRPPLEEIPSNIRKAISDNNLLDRELYGYAQVLYEARVAELRGEMAEEQAPEAIEVIAITATRWQRFKSWFAINILRRKNV